jgi:hypothetical protein
MVVGERAKKVHIYIYNALDADKMSMHGILKSTCTKKIRFIIISLEKKYIRRRCVCLRLDISREKINKSPQKRPKN